MPLRDEGEAQRRFKGNLANLLLFDIRRKRRRQTNARKETANPKNVPDVGVVGEFAEEGRADAGHPQAKPKRRPRSGRQRRRKENTNR
jgi:hypothetical protein